MAGVRTYSRPSMFGGSDGVRAASVSFDPAISAVIKETGGGTVLNP
jgi:hypothetical protein